MKRRPVGLVILLMLCLSACRSSLIANLVTQPGDRLFWDDFSDSSGHWPQISGPDGRASVSAGTYRFQVLTAQHELLATPGYRFGDVQVEADAERMGGPMQNLFGLVCRSANLENFYFFAISSDGYYGIGKVKDGRVSILGQAMMAYSPVILQGAPNHLRFDCIGGTLKGSVNGQFLALGKDADFTSGEAGLMAGAPGSPGVDVAFDNFVVYKP